MKKKNFEIIIAKVEKIRSQNNKNWMDLLRLAFSHAPKKASIIMKRINLADKQISKNISKLGKVNHKKL